MSSRIRKAIVVVLAVALPSGMVGCGASMYPVRGKVTYPDGTPLAEGMVVFESQGQEKLITARGDIQADGRYELSTRKPGDGILAGKYRVLVAPRADPNAVDRPSRSAPFDQRFMNFNTSGLEFEVTPAGPNEYPIQVTRSNP
jgi:hypothetical protein